MSLTEQEASDLFRSAPTRFLDVGGDSEVAYRTVGSGPDVVFVHGWPVSGATFRRLLPHLAPHVTCHLLDLPGAGASRHSANSPLSIEHHINSVRRSVDALGLERFAVVGHDSGGMIARHAMAGDARLRAMALVDTDLLDELLGTLDGRARYAVEARFGLLDGERKSFREVGESLGVTAEAARRLVSRAVAGLREDAERILAA